MTVDTDAGVAAGVANMVWPPLVLEVELGKEVDVPLVTGSALGVGEEEEEEEEDDDDEEEEEVVVVAAVAAAAAGVIVAGVAVE